MPLVPAKCPECGGNINIDPEKKAAVCEFCKQPFVVEDAINNFNTTYNITNNNEIKADVVNVFDASSNVSNLISRAKEYIDNVFYEKAEEYLNKALDSAPQNTEARSLLEDIIRKKGELKLGETYKGVVQGGHTFIDIALPYHRGVISEKSLKNIYPGYKEGLQAEFVIVEKYKFPPERYYVTPKESELGALLTSDVKVTTLVITYENYTSETLSFIFNKHPEIEKIYIDGPLVWGNSDGEVPDPFPKIKHKIKSLEIPDKIEFRSYYEEKLWPHIIDNVETLVVSEKKLMEIRHRLENTKHYDMYLKLCRQRMICPRCNRPLEKKFTRGYVCSNNRCSSYKQKPFNDM